MSRRWSMLVGVLVLVAVSCAADRVDSYTDADTGVEITVATGDRFELRLTSNPSTGFRWLTVPGDIDRALDLLSEIYEEPDSDRVGAAGTQVFAYEATGPGAGVLRLEYVRPFDDPAVPERVVEYLVRIDDAPWPPATTAEPPTTGTATAPDTATSTTSQPSDAIEVDQLFDGEGPRVAAVRGFLVADKTGTRLCSVLMESYPPQCGWAWVVVPNAEGLDHGFEEAHGVRWTPSPIVVAGTFDGVRLIADGGLPDVTVTARDKALAEAFWRFSTSGTGFDDLPLADEVAIGLGSRIDRTVVAGALRDRTAWIIDAAEYAGMAGPFSALDLAADGYDLLVGAHPRCAAPAAPAPAGLGGHRRVSLQPEDATSCIEWWTIDFFVADDGRIEAVTVDLVGP